MDHTIVCLTEVYPNSCRGNIAHLVEVAFVRAGVSPLLWNKLFAGWGRLWAYSSTEAGDVVFLLSLQMSLVLGAPYAGLLAHLYYVD